MGEHERNSTKTAKLDALLVQPDKHPQMIQIDPGLHPLQAAVGGDIEAVYPFEDQVAIIVNDEGKINGLPLNRALRDDDGEIYDVIAGDFLVVGLTRDSFGSLTPGQVEKFEKLFHAPEIFLKMGHSIMAIPLPDDIVAEREKVKAQAPTRKKARTSQER